MMYICEALFTACRATIGAAMGNNVFATGTLVLVMQVWLKLIQHVGGRVILIIFSICPHTLKKNVIFRSH